MSQLIPKLMPFVHEIRLLLARFGVVKDVLQSFAVDVVVACNDALADSMCC